MAELDWWTRQKRTWGFEERVFDMFTQGGTPLMLRAIENAPQPHRITIGATDCIARAHILGKKGLKIDSLKDLSGMRLGASSPLSTMGFQLRLLSEKMGWEFDKDFRFVDLRDDGLEELEMNEVDAAILGEIAYSKAVEQGYPVLFDFSIWNENIAGNSISVSPEWLEDETNREAARRLLMALAEAISLYHRDRDLAVRILVDWTGMPNETAQRIYERGAWLPLKPYPCHAGYRRTIELFDSPKVRQHKPEEFFDDSIVREIDESGFFDRL